MFKFLYSDFKNAFNEIKPIKTRMLKNSAMLIEKYIVYYLLLDFFSLKKDERT